jgi:hypothetical protein
MQFFAPSTDHAGRTAAVQIELVTGQRWRALTDAGHRIQRAAAPPAQRFDPPGQPSLQIRGYLPGTTVRRRAIGASLQYHIEVPAPGAVLKGVLVSAYSLCCRMAYGLM